MVLVCEVEILNITETSLFDKKVTIEKNNCLIYTISLVIILLLLDAISISCYYYYYYTKHWLKKGIHIIVLIWNIKWIV